MPLSKFFSLTGAVSKCPILGRQQARVQILQTSAKERRIAAFAGIGILSECLKAGAVIKLQAGDDAKTRTCET